MATKLTLTVDKDYRIKLFIDPQNVHLRRTLIVKHHAIFTYYMFLWNNCRSGGTFRDKLGVFKRLFLKDLIDAAKEYAHHSNRSLSKIAEDYLRSVLKIKEEVISLLHF